jgi:multidrug efflux pump subunit AcrB
MAELKRSFPEGIDYRIAYDPTIFVRASLRSVIITLFEAVALVVIVVVLFLQSWRASLIPLAAVPVSIVGTFAAMHALGFSLNTLSLFGLVLAIGIVVDDAIVVVENVERHLARGLDRVEAARIAMREVTGPILATMFVLVAVFVPTAFLSGLTGQFYRQFALTIAISTVISAINSLTLSPALAATILRPHAAASPVARGLLARIAAGFFGPFNRFVERTTGRYVSGVNRFLRVSAIGGGLYLALGALTWLGFAKTPLGFVPSQDKYYLVGIVQLPDGASLDRTEASVRQVTDILLAEPGVENVVAFPGLSISGFANLPNAGAVRAAPNARSLRRRDRRPDQSETPRRARRVFRHLPAAARARPRRHRRLQAPGAGPRQPGLRRAPRRDGTTHRRSAPAPRTDRSLHQFPGQRPAAPPRR